MPGASTAPTACVKRKHAMVAAGSPKTSGIPRANGFNGFLRARPGDRALLSPWVTTLARCTGYQRRDIRPTRLRRPLVRAFVLCVTSVHRIPRPTFCDDRETPLLSRRDTRRSAGDLPDVTSDNTCDTLARRANQVGFSSW